MAVKYEAKNIDPSKILEMEKGSDGVYCWSVDIFVGKVKKVLNI